MDSKLAAAVIAALVTLSPLTADAQRREAVACLGDSLTVGYGPLLETPSRRRCRVLAEVGRPTREMVKALRSDVLGAGTGVGVVVVLGGTNDVARPNGAEDARTNLSRIYRAAREAGLVVIAVTIPPLGGSWVARSAGADETRQAVERLNRWIREEAPVDAVVDANRLLADAARPDRFDARLSRGDHIHPNGEGRRVLAQAIAAQIDQMLASRTAKDK